MAMKVTAIILQGYMQRMVEKLILKHTDVTVTIYIFLYVITLESRKIFKR